MHFILDTGVKTTILTENFLKQFLGLTDLKPVRIRGLGEGDVIRAEMAQNTNMQIPGLVGKGINMIIMPEGLISYSGMFGKPVYGIIGYEIFGQFVVEINYQEKFVRLHDPFRYKPRKKDRQRTVPIELRKSKPYVTASMIDHQGAEIEAKWLIDTGASHAISLFDPQLTPPSPSVNAFLGMGLSGHVYGKIGRAPSFKIGDHNFQNVIAGYPDSESLNLLPTEQDWYGNIGAEIISRFNIIFDYRNRIIYLRRNSQFRKKFDYNSTGLEIVSSGSRFELFSITYVAPESPAEKAGVQVNDIILSLNGMPVNGLDINDMYSSLRKRSGGVVTLKIKRGNKTFKKRFKLEEEI
ncbi:MAG: PDZ domain-containing protein [Bacteroidota bacterium]